MLLGPWLRYVRDVLRTDSAVLAREAVDLTGEIGEVTALLGAGGCARDRRRESSLRAVADLAGGAGGRSVQRGLGAEHVAELDLHAYGMDLECHIVDFGSGGLLGFPARLDLSRDGCRTAGRVARGRSRSPDPAAPRSERAEPRARLAGRHPLRAAGQPPPHGRRRARRCSAITATTNWPGRSSSRRSSATVRRTRRSPAGSISAARPTFVACRRRPARLGAELSPRLRG